MLNTFVHHSPYGKGRYRAAVYVQARTCRASMFKCMTGFLSFRQACEVAERLARRPKESSNDHAQEKTLDLL